MISPELNEAMDKIIGAWSDANDECFFLFTDPEKNWNKTTMTFRINGKLNSVPYFISETPISKLKFLIHPQIPVPPFNYGNIVLEFIGDDTIELTNYEQVYTLMRISSGFEHVFEIGK